MEYTMSKKKDASNLMNVDNIVSSDVKEIKLDPLFKKSYNLTDFDEAVVRAAVLSDQGMTAYQAQHFVANSQITPYKQVRQSLMELEVRYHAFQEIRANLRKAEIMRLKMIQQRDAFEDPLDKELMQIDIDKGDYDITIYKRKLRQSEYEMKAFLDVVNRYAQTEEELEYYLGINEEEERDYWIARMGKQAALDIIAFGRVGSGNMDSIAMMNRDDQLEALTAAVQYSGLINAGLHKISNNVQSTVDKYLSSNSNQIAEILDKPNENIQLTAQSKTKPESI
jgi:hypothetical protein